MACLRNHLRLQLNDSFQKRERCSDQSLIAALKSYRAYLTMANLMGQRKTAPEGAVERTICTCDDIHLSLSLLRFLSKLILSKAALPYREEDLHQ